MALEIILLVLAVAGIYEGVRLSKSVLLFVDPVGPGWYLFFMSCLLLVCAIALLVKQFIGRKAGRREVGLALHKGPAGRALILLLLYGVAIIYLGLCRRQRHLLHMWFSASSGSVPGSGVR